MNSINIFSSKKKFPLSTQVVDFMQNMIKQAYQIAKIGGVDNYILSGCENINGNIWATGYVVVNGELLPFMGGTGTLTGNVRIKEVKTDIVAGYDTYDQAYTTRYVEFGSNIGNTDTFVWNTFTRLKSNAEIVRDFATKAELDAVRLLVMPKGAIIDYDLLNNPLPLPIGWHFADGSTIAGYGILPDRRKRVPIGFDPMSNNNPTNVIDQKTENYGRVGNTGGKPLFTLNADNIPQLTIKGRGGADDKNFSAQDALSGADKEPNAGWDFDYHIGSANPSSIDNRMPYVVAYFIVKYV